MTTITDLRYLSFDSLPDQEQIKALLREMSTRESVIDWFFLALQQQQQKNIILQHELRAVKAQLPEE